MAPAEQKLTALNGEGTLTNDETAERSIHFHDVPPTKHAVRDTRSSEYSDPSCPRRWEAPPPVASSRRPTRSSLGLQLSHHLCSSTVKASLSPPREAKARRARSLPFRSMGQPFPSPTTLILLLSRHH